MRGKAKHIWDNWGKKNKPPYIPPTEVRLTIDFINDNNINTKAMENTRGFAEIVDTVTDAIKMELAAVEAFQGKFETVKVITWAFNNYPNVKEAFDDWPVFEAEIKDLFAEEGIEALEAIGRNLSEEEKEKSRLYKVVSFAAVGYKNTLDVIELGKQQLALGAAIFA